MYTTKEGKKYGSSYVGKKKDEMHSDGPEKFGSYSPDQPGEENENEHSTPKEHTADKVNSFDKSDVKKNVHAEDAHVEEPSATVASHGAAHTVEYSHDGDSHKVRSTHEDGHTTDSAHTSAADAYGHGKALAFEAGGDEQATSPKKREHYSQQGAESEDRNYEQPDLA